MPISIESQWTGHVADLLLLTGEVKALGEQSLGPDELKEIKAKLNQIQWATTACGTEISKLERVFAK